jgi:hypothetical protein
MHDVCICLSLDGAVVKIGDLLYVKHHAAGTRFVTAACPDPTLALFSVVPLTPFTSCFDNVKLINNAN